MHWFRRRARMGGLSEASAGRRSSGRSTFMVSPQAGYVTGQTIVVDGGLLAS